ncbi:MAG: quinolinate synthase [Candidatus Tokpelaia sp. JSC161]|nr:MAG: quinolinate synthase [Candidatus Tokpelaia sp. JSC161]
MPDSYLNAIYSKVKNIIPPAEWCIFFDEIKKIHSLKRELNAVILAHNYQTPEIVHGVADIVGDSLLLAREAKNMDAQTIVVAGVYFMAETVKLLNQERTVLIPDAKAGCSLAESITPSDVEILKEAFPNTPIVTYVNTSAAVKAVSDICCTSANAKYIVESLGVPRVLMIPDEYLAQNVAHETRVEILTWKGHCEIHEKFTQDDIRQLRYSYPNALILAHPECSPHVIERVDFSGSTAHMSDFIANRKPRQVVLLTECSMSDNVSVSLNDPDIEFIRSCNLCPHMKRITLTKIREALEKNNYEVRLHPEIAEKARVSVERMLDA